MTELLTAAQMRAIERAAIEAGEVTGLELMERAGRGVVDAMLKWRPELATAPHRAVVLCGPGNNGGDGFVVARLLKERGWDVEVFLYGRDPAEIDSLPPDAAENARRWREMGEIDSYPGGWSGGEDDPMFIEADIVVDALFGTGLGRALPEALLGFAAMTTELMGPAIGPRLLSVVAVDAPSGLCTDSGKALICSEGWPAAVEADLTVSFHRLKLGHFLGLAPELCGELGCVDIGLDRLPIGPPAPPAGARVSARLVEDTGIGLRKVTGHKYDHGHALVLSGGVGKGGAARMAARGALRIGAGLVTVGCPPAALQENASALDAVMLRAFGEAGELAAFLPERKVNALCIGPGFGHGDRLRAFLGAVLRAEGPPGAADGDAAWFIARGMGADGLPAVVLDADAIGEFADDPETLFAMLHPACVLTPHQGEFGRLFPDLLEKLTAPATKGPAYSKVDATREAAARAGCVVLFKGPDTVIADPAGRCAVSSAAYERGAPWLATAGTGDVLAGFITGLLARGFSAFDAAQTAAWLHVECALHFGPGLIAEDLPEQLPAVFRKLGL